MAIAAKRLSQVSVHMGIAFGLMYVLTGSAAFGGLAAVLEPVINVALLPFHERMWQALRARFASRRLTLLVAQKGSQTAMHASVAFGVLYVATGSLAFGGLAAVLEPIVNVIALPLHDRLFERHVLRSIPATLTAEPVRRVSHATPPRYGAALQSLLTALMGTHRSAFLRQISNDGIAS